MPVIIDYILKLNICLIVVYLFYQLLLRRLTFYNWNRWYLIGYTVLSFIIPLIDIMPSLEKRHLQQTVVLEWVPVLNFSTPVAESFFASLSLMDWAGLIAIAGILFLFGRFGIRYLAYLRMKSRARLISDDGIAIYQLEEEMSPFSFGNSIFINIHLHQGEELEEVIRHEFVHVKQRHTMDIVWFELLCILNWFNPFVWLLKYCVKQNLEFIADDKILQQGLDKRQYQYLLLKVMGNRQFAFTNHFNFSSLKKRIAMMNTMKTAQVHLLKFLFVLPVVAVLLLSFRKHSQTLELSEGSTPLQVSEIVQENETENSLAIPTAAFSPETIPADTMPPKRMTMFFTSTDSADQSDRSPSEKPTIMIDGVVQDPDFDLDQINVESIASIAVFKSGPAGDSQEGQVGGGLIKITTRKAATLSGKKVPSDQGETAIAFDKKSNGATNDRSAVGQGRIIFKQEASHSKNDGKQTDQDRIVFSAKTQPLSERSAIKELPAQVHSQSSPAVAEIVDKPQAVSGNTHLQGRVSGIRIRKSQAKPASSSNSLESVVVTGYRSGTNTYRSKPASLQNMLKGVGTKVLFVVNGHKVSNRQIKKLNTGTIQSITVLKGETAIGSYGKKAKHGVIEITTH